MKRRRNFTAPGSNWQHAQMGNGFGPPPSANSIPRFPPNFGEQQNDFHFRASVIEFKKKLISNLQSNNDSAMLFSRGQDLEEEMLGKCRHKINIIGAAIP